MASHQIGNLSSFDYNINVTNLYITHTCMHKFGNKFRFRSNTSNGTMVNIKFFSKCKNKRAYILTIHKFSVSLQINVIFHKFFHENSRRYKWCGYDTSRTGCA